MARVLVYALGGGLGHATRGAGLASALRREGVEARAWVRAEAAPHVTEHADVVERCERPASAEALRAALDEVLTRFEATHVVVDTFPEGILGELTPLGLPTAVVLRARRDGHERGFLERLEGYDHRFDVEPELRWLGPTHAEALPPCVRELTPRPSHVDALLVASDGRLVSFFRRLRDQLAARGLRVELVEDAQATLTGHDLSAKVVVGPAGYNLTYELASLGTWHLALPLGRRFDDQHRRANEVAIVCDDPMALEERVISLARGAERRPRSRVTPHRALAHQIAASLGLGASHGG